MGLSEWRTANLGDLLWYVIYLSAFPPILVG